MDKNSSIYVAGHSGLVGSSVVKQLKKSGYSNLLLAKHSDLDLMDSYAVKDFFKANKPEYIIDCAAKVGGIGENITHPAEFLYNNLQIQNNLMWQSKEAKVKKFLFVGSAVIYTKELPQPIKEDYFMRGAPDSANAGYAHAKIAGIKLCEYINEQFNLGFISCAPTNLYGEGDNFNLKSAHVIPALIQRMHEAKINNTPEVVIWGSGKSRREFLFVDDLAYAIIWLMNNYDEKELLNIGTGEDISIKEVATLIKNLVGYEGRLIFDSSKPEGVPRRLLDVSKLHDIGWKHKTSIEDGLKRTYKWYLNNLSQ
jgi:GDP-L-fucose synthase